MFTATKSTTISMANPMIPFRSVVDTMHQGMTTFAPRISSAICEQVLVQATNHEYEQESASIHGPRSQYLNKRLVR